MAFCLPKLCKNDGKSWKIDHRRVLGGSWEPIGSTWGLQAEIFMNFHDFWGPLGEQESTRNVKNRCHNSKFFQESLEKRYRSHFFLEKCVKDALPLEIIREGWATRQMSFIDIGPQIFDQMVSIMSDRFSPSCCCILGTAAWLTWQCPSSQTAVRIIRRNENVHLESLKKKRG